MVLEVRVSLFEDDGDLGYAMFSISQREGSEGGFALTLTSNSSFGSFQSEHHANPHGWPPFDQNQAQKVSKVKKKKHI